MTAIASHSCSCLVPMQPPYDQDMPGAVSLRHGASRLGPGWTSLRNQERYAFATASQL